MRFHFSSFPAYRAFIGSRVFILLLLSIVAALLTSFVEIVFSVLVQTFFVVLGILRPELALAPPWAPKELASAIVYLIAFSAARTLLQAFKALAQGLTLESFNAHMRSRILHWALRHSQWDSSRIMTLMNDRVHSAGHMLMAMQNLTIQLITCGAIFSYLLFTSAALALSGVALLLALGLLLKLVDRYATRAGERVSQLSSLFNNRFLGALGNVQFLRVCRLEAREIGLIRTYLTDYFRSHKHYLSVMGLKYAAPQFFGVLVVIAISLIAQRQQLVSAGTLLAFLYLFVRMSQSISELSASSTIMRMYLPQTRELFWWAKDHPEEAGSDEPAGAKRSSGPPVSLPPPSWGLDGIDLEIGGQKILSQLSLQLPAGRITVLRGPSGVGKSTLLGVLAGVVLPTRGSATVSGSIIGEQVSRGTLRLGFVGPDPVVIGGSLRENLLYGTESIASEQELRSCLELACCSDFVSSHPSGLERIINDRGEGLSTGQKQRLALARALLRRPNALLLDEPTANLDERSKEMIKGSLRRLKGETTIVIATHDDSLLEVADQVFELRRS